MLLNDRLPVGKSPYLYWLGGTEQSTGDRAIIYFQYHGDLENKIMMDQGICYLRCQSRQLHGQRHLPGRNAAKGHPNPQRQA